MSGANKNEQGNFGFPAAYIGGIVLTLTVYTLGVKLRGLCAVGVAPTFICLGLLIFCIVGSVVGTRLFGKKLKARSVAETNAIADVRRQRMEENPVREWAKLRRLCILGFAYVAFLWSLCLGTVFLYGLSRLGTEWIILELIPMFFLSGLIGKAIKEKNPGNQTEALPEDQFPQLYRLVRDAAGEKLSGKKLSIRVLHGIPDEECNAALALDEKEISLWIGAVLLCVLDESELKQVVLHEFAHMNKGDISENKLFNRIMDYVTADPKSVFGGLSEMALSLISGILYQEGQYYFLLSSRSKENRADHHAASLGDRQKQASALAKISAHSLYCYESEPYDNLFFSAEVPQHLMTERAKAFRNALNSRADAWKTILEREIPSRVATHPTFRQRWEALDCCAYTLVPAETESEFARECWKAAETADAERAEIPKDQYEKLRKESYLDDMEVIREYESREAELTPEELRRPMLAYYKTGTPEKMEEICDQIFRDYDSPFSTAFASYWKGILLLRRYDKAGLDYLYRAMEANTNYIENGLSEIGRFCTLMGLEQELQEYRTRAPELMQLKVDRNVGGIQAGSKLTAAELPENWLEKILSSILDAAGDDMDAVYLVKEMASEDYTPSSFVLRFREETAPERMDDVYERVFSLLDDWPEDYEFCLYYYEPAMEKLLSKVDGSCIWHR